MKTTAISSKRVGTDFTQGSILKQMVKFGLPLLLASFLQQLYNAVDTMVIGRCEGTIGTVGVSNGGEIATVITFVAMAFGNAGQIYISQLFGAKNEQGIKESTGTLLTFTFLLSVVSMILSLLFCKPLLLWLNTQQEAMGEAINYMRIVSFGLPAVFGYNAACGIMRGMGEAKRPLQFITIAAITNFVLDLLLVWVFPLAAAGTAIATIVAQYASFGAAMVFLYRNQARFGFEFKRHSFRMHINRLKVVLALGIPMTFQSAMIHLTQLYCTSRINEFGMVPSATSSIGNRIYRLLHVATTSISTSTSTMIGQNLGAGKQGRAKRIVYVCMACCAVIAVFEISVALLFPRQIFSLFGAEPEVVELGVTYMRIVVVACILCIFHTPYEAMVTGSGNSRLRFLSGFLDGVVFRLGIGIPLSHVIGAPAYWLANNIAHLAPILVCGTYFYSGKWQTHRLLKEEDKAPQPSMGTEEE